MKQLLIPALLLALNTAHAAPPLDCKAPARASGSPLKDSDQQQARRSGDKLAEADAMYAVAEIRYRSYKTFEGDQMVLDADTVLRAMPASAELAGQLQQRARKWLDLNNCALAASLLRIALPVSDEASGPTHPQSISVLADLVRIDLAQRNLDSLARNAPRLSEAWIAQGEPADSITAPVYRAAIDVYAKRGQYAQAEQLAQRNLKNGEREFGASNPMLTARLSDLASLYYNQMRYDEGEAVMNRSDAIYAQANPQSPQRYKLSKALLIKAQLRARFNSGDVAGALTLGEQEIKLLENTVDSDQQALQVASDARTNPAPGQSITLANVETQTRNRLRSSEVQLADVRVKVGELHHSQRHYREAEAMYQQAMATYQRYESGSTSTASLKSDLAMLYRAQGDNASAEPLRSQALEVLLQAYGSKHPDVIDSASELAAIYKRQGKAAEIAALAERVPDLRR